MSDPQGAASTSWDMSQERAFMENLFCQRFNFFLIVFSVVLAGAATAASQPKQTALLAFGYVLCALIALTIYRNYVKLMIILKVLHAIPDHPVAVSGRLVKKEALGGLFGVNPIIGIVIPILCTACLAIAAWLSWTGQLRAQ